MVLERIYPGTVGFIALAGGFCGVWGNHAAVACYAWNKHIAQGKTSADDLLNAIRKGAVFCVRPKAMTVAVILAGLFPHHVGRRQWLQGHAAYRRADGGGMITAPLLSMFVIPVVYLLMWRPREPRVAGKPFWK